MKQPTASGDRTTLSAHADGSLSVTGEGASDDRGGGPPDGGNSPGHERGADANVTLPQIEANSTVDVLHDARDTLEDIPLENSSAAPLRDKAINSTNAAAEEYRQDVFANTTAAFTHIRDAQRTLEQLQSDVGAEHNDEIEQANTELATASNVSARLATREAYELVETYEDEFSNPGQRQKAESALGNAADAVTRGDDADGSNATVQYRNAWKQADKAVTTVEDNIDPSLAVTQGRAVERNETVMVSIAIELTDARPYTYEEATVTIDDTETERTPLTTDPFAGGSATGTVTVDIGRELENRTVSVIANSTHDSNRSVSETIVIDVDKEDVRPRIPAPDEYNEVEIADEDSGVNVEVGGEGVHSGELEIRNETVANGSVETVGPMIRITNTTDIDRATVSIPIDESVKTPDDVTIITWDPAEDDRWHELDTDIDTANLTASTNVSSFSYFTVVPSGHRVSYKDSASLDWPALEDFQSLDGWDRDGTVTVADGTAILESEIEDSGGGGDVGDGDDGDDGNDGGDGGDDGDGDGGDDPPELEICFPFIGCITIPNPYEPIPHPPLLTASEETDEQRDIIQQSTGTVDEEAQLERTFEIPDGADRVWFETRASSSVTNGGVTIVVEGESGTEVVHQDTGSTGWETYDADLTSFAGEEVTVQFKTEGTAELEVDYVGTLVDSAGSGFPDEVERLDLEMPAGDGDVYGSPLALSPTLADTSGDGLTDSEVVDIEWEFSDRFGGEWVLEAEVTGASAHPALTDTDGDGLSDAEELEVWETDPLQMDTSNDGFIDPVDPHPNEHSPPPEVRLFSQNYKDGILVAVDDKSTIESVEGNPYYDPPGIDSKWDTDEATTYDLDEELGSIEEWLYENVGLMREEDDYSIMFDTHWGFGPEKYYVTVTDEYDNEVSFLVDVDSGGAEIAKAGVVVGGTASVPLDGPTAPVSAIAGLLTLAGSGALYLASEQGYFGTSSEVEEVPVENMHETREQTWEAPDGSEIALPSGAIHEQSYYTGHVRGYGWEYIRETTSLTQTDLGYAIRTQDAVVYENDEIRYIIGNGLGTDEKVILSIIGATIVTASQGYDSVDEPTEGCQKQVYYNREKLTDHVIDTDKKSIESIQTIIDAVTDPFQVWKSNKYRYYVGSNSDGYYIVKVTKENPFFDLVINTVLMGEGGSYYDTLEDAEDQLGNNQPDDPSEIEDTTEPNC